MKNIRSVCFRSQRTVYIGSRLFRNAKKSPYCFDVCLLTQGLLVDVDCVNETRDFILVALLDGIV